jgi:hypothetical protein
MLTCRCCSGGRCLPIPGTFCRTSGLGRTFDPPLSCSVPVWILAAMRVDFDPQSMSGRDFYKLLTATVVPRPIAWVSSTGADGTDNLAPARF